MLISGNVGMSIEKVDYKSVILIIQLNIGTCTGNVIRFKLNTSTELIMMIVNFNAVLFDAEHDASSQPLSRIKEHAASL